MNREEIINSYNKEEFMDFLENDNTGKIFELLNEEGLDILYNSRRKEERISYILSFSKYKNELLHNKDFLDIFLDSELSSYYATLENLNDDTYDLIIKTYIEIANSPSQIARLFSYFNTEYKLKVLDSWPYNKEILYELINYDETKIINKIINNYDIDLSNKIINLSSFINKTANTLFKNYEYRNKGLPIQEEINIPVRLINKDLGKKLWNNYDIFQIRSIINKLEYITNPEELNNYIKQKEETIINNYNNNIFNSPYKDIYELIDNMILSKEQNNIDKYNEYYHKYIEIINKCKILEIHKKLRIYYEEGNREASYNYLKELSNRFLSNYIIDYNFEENYHNIMIDIRELLRFHYDGNINLPEEKIELYESISNIDYLSIEEKKELHNKLKHINIKELFYDDMSKARYIVNEAIKEYSLTKETIKQYKDEHLSKELGVDVYKIDDEPFFGIVKTTRNIEDDLPTGHSFSLIGKDSISVFGNVKNASTFLYDADDLNPEQIVHAFPYDSFTLYKPFELNNESTDRVRTLMMPEDITGLAGYYYTELLILEQGKKQTDIDDKIKKLKQIALYCQDEITEKDIEVAKKNNIGIILIKSKKYLENWQYYKDKYKNIEDLFNYTYFDGISEKNKHESRR